MAHHSNYTHGKSKADKVGNNRTDDTRECHRVTRFVKNGILRCHHYKASVVRRNNSLDCMIEVLATVAGQDRVPVTRQVHMNIILVNV